MAGGVIAAGIMGVASSVIQAAVQIAQTAAANARGNLKGSIQVINGTEYELIPAHAQFRRGAASHGTEGEFYTTPNLIDPRKIDVFSYQQVLGATTDVVGCVVYRCPVFDLLIGWHVFDRAGIHRYLMSGLFPPASTDSFFTEKGEGKFNGWDMDLNQTLNKYIWSGAWKGTPNDYATTGVSTGMALRVNGTVKRGNVIKNADGSYKVDEQGYPIITHQDELVKGELVFSTSSVGGGTEMQVSVSDFPEQYRGKPDNKNRVRTVTLPG